MEDGSGGLGGPPTNPKQLPGAMDNISTRHRLSENFYLEAGRWCTDVQALQLLNRRVCMGLRGRAVHPLLPVIGA